MTGAAFHVDRVDYAVHAAALHAVREAVFVHEQHVPADLERDAFDATGWHVLARDAEGAPIGAGRLTTRQTLGRMAVLPGWRSRGVGEAMLAALVAQAVDLGWPELSLHAQVAAIEFYARNGFVPRGPRFIEAGIDHQDMHRQLAGPTPIETREAALAAVQAVLHGARRRVRIYSRELDPGLLDQSAVLSSFRRWSTSGGTVQVLLQDCETPRHALAPLIGLAQRLSSAFEFRVIEEPVDRGYPGAFVVNDTGGWYFRPLGHRFDGEADIDGGARARQLHAVFDPVWERARPVSEFRVLGI